MKTNYLQYSIAYLIFFIWNFGIFYIDYHKNYDYLTYGWLLLSLICFILSLSNYIKYIIDKQINH